ncbi:MAG: cation transporter [Chitinophagales bacterium]|nr:cation transporter [Chitinophagales bacterium]
MDTLQFNTSINCQNCVRLVSSYLDEEQSIESWEVDTANPDKVLTVRGAALDKEHIIETVKSAGFEISPK